MKLVFTVPNLSKQDIEDFQSGKNIKKDLVTRILADALSLACEDSISEYSIGVEIKE